MSEKPILFSVPMVQAIMREYSPKTQTRRVINPQPKSTPEFVANRYTWVHRYTSYALMDDESVKRECAKVAPYQVGDILWVREPWFCKPCLPDCAGRENEDECPFKRAGENCFGYKAQYSDGSRGIDVKWRPSIHMPRSAARLFLQVTDVRAERVQDITPQDAFAEGCDGRGSAPHDGASSDWQKEYDFSVEKFQTLWDALNAKRGFGWDTNPWVWVYSFELIEDHSKREVIPAQYPK
ncbi:MAG TPA: hypothetical protein DEQ02_06735 [Ruminococcaceae bacterium]|nr:hypothetical protein [Oscillospiraceae bacterium]